MKPHPHIRKTIKWGGAAVTVLLVVVWVGSGWYIATWLSPFSREVVIGSGIAQVSEIPSRRHTPGELGFQCGPISSFRLFLLPHWRSGRGGDWSLSIPLWLPAALSMLVTALAWRLDTLARRRARLNLCPKCDYDRTGLVGGAGAVCPECGDRPSSA